MCLPVLVFMDAKGSSSCTVGTGSSHPKNTRQFAHKIVQRYQLLFVFRMTYNFYRCRLALASDGWTGTTDPLVKHGTSCSAAGPVWTRQLAALLSGAPKLINVCRKQ